MTYNKDINELHERNYSIYDNKEAEQLALEELQHRSYLIFDEEETINLLIAYEDEVNHLAQDVSLSSLQNRMKEDLFLDRRRALLGEIISMLSNHLEKANAPQIFYLKKEKESFRRCNASGRYNPLKKSFVLLAGSLLALDVTPSYRYTPGELQRRIFIEKECVKTDQGFCLIRDFNFSSLNQATNFVLGRYASGKDEWVNDVGCKLGDYYHLK